MMKTRTGIGGTLLLALATMVGCSDGTGPEPPIGLPAQGSIQASFDGPVTGQLDASGEAPTANDVSPRSMAFGLDLSAQAGVDGYIVSGLDITGESGIAASLTFVGSGTGEYEVDMECDIGDNQCMFGGFEFVENIGSFSMTARLFELQSGTVTISSVANGRIVGSFSGIALEMDPTTWQAVNDEELEVELGTFDVPVIDWADLPRFQQERVDPRIQRGL